MNRNRLKQNLKNVVSEERHLRFVYDEETELYVPYENPDELRLMSDYGKTYKIAFGELELGKYYFETDVTDNYYPAECLLFNDEEYYKDVRCFVAYPQNDTGAYSIVPSSEGDVINRSFALFSLKIEDNAPLGYKRMDRVMLMGTIVG